MTHRDEAIDRLNQFIDILQRDGVIRIGEFDHWWPDWSHCWLFRHKDEAHDSSLAGWEHEVAKVDTALENLRDYTLVWEIIKEPRPKPGEMLASPKTHIRRVEL